MGRQLIYCVVASVPDSGVAAWKPSLTLEPCPTRSFAT